MSEESNPIIGYADSYRQMARTGTTSIDVWSIITDLERNMAPLTTAAQSELAALREELAAAKQLGSLWKEQERLRGIQAINAGEALKAAEQRNANAANILNDLRDDPRLWLMVSSDTALRIGEFLKAQPTESGASE